MLRHTRLEHRFVHHVPERLEPGVLYISMDFATAVHRCCCGCGEEIVTPFTPTDWRMTFDGETISLRPSVGNWNIPCRSHYVIERSRVLEALPWSDDEIANERHRDKEAKESFYDVAARAEVNQSAPVTDTRFDKAPSVWLRIRSWVTRKPTGTK